MANKKEYTCAICEKEFFDWPSNGHRVVCSHKCRAKKKTRDSETAIRCFVCGKIFFALFYEAKTRKTCSTSCRGALNVDVEKMMGNKYAFLGDAATDNAHRWRARQVDLPPSSCNRCGGNGDLLHHIDGNVKNNDASNLERLCRACHINHHRDALMNGRVASIERRASL